MARQALKISGRTVEVSNLDKIFYPAAKFTKAQILDYYIRIAPFLLPHLRGRPLTLKRYPEGVRGPFFYEKRCPPYRPPWLKVAKVWSETKGVIPFCTVNDLPELVWIVNLADLELHTFLSRAPDVKRPTMLVFDLDPGAPADILDCAALAEKIRKVLEGAGLKSFPKTSGSKGLQVYVPLNTKTTFEKTGAFAKALAELFAAAEPKRVVAKMTRSLRRGKVFIDWSQNNEHKTTICVYSLRAKEKPTVSTPVTWKELRDAVKKKDADRLVFSPEEALKRAKRLGDLFEPVLKLKQKLPLPKALVL